MTLNFLAPEDVEQIIAEGLGLLDDPGVRIHNDDALNLLAEAGATVDCSRQVARIPETLVWESLRTAPQEFDLYDLAGKPAVHYGSDQIHFDPGSAAVSILDSQTGKPRPPVTADFIKFVRLVENLPQLDAQSTAMVCQDVPESAGDWYRLYLALRYMTKPIVTGAFGKETWWTMYELLAAAAGGEAELADRPTAVFDVCPSPPLLWSDLTCQNLIDCARKGVPAELVSMPLAGVTSPVTLASAVVQHTAESLSGIVISQLAKVGAKIVWGGAPAAIDMRTGATPMGDAATWLIDGGYVQVGKSLGLPTHTYMGSSDAKLIDAQSGLESAGGIIVAALLGVNMISGVGMLDFLRCQSPEKLVIDAEVISMARRLTRGIELREQPVALERMRRLPHRADHMGQAHTLKWMSKELNIPSEVIDRGSQEAWERRGSLSAADRARQRAASLSENCRPSPLSPEAHAELERIALSALRKSGMENLPELI